MKKPKSIFCYERQNKNSETINYWRGWNLHQSFDHSGRDQIKNIQAFLGAKNTFTYKHKLVKSENGLPTGSFNLDQILGCNGLPQGQIIELYGFDSSYKSTFCLSLIAACQAKELIAIYIDVKGTFNPKWAKKLGVHLDNLLVASPNSGEETFEIIHTLIKTELVGLIIVDGITAMIPEAEFVQAINPQNINNHIMMMKKGIQKLQNSLIHSKTTVIFINQIQKKISQGYGWTYTTFGGSALRYASGIRLEISKIKKIEEDYKLVGEQIQIIAIKNKFAPPCQRCILDFYFATGFDYEEEVIKTAIQKQLIVRSGSWYLYKKNKLAQGIKGLKTLLNSNSKLLEEIKSEIIKLMNF